MTGSSIGSLPGPQSNGAAPLPAPDIEGHVGFEGARIWYAAFGSGPPVIMLHGALGNGDDWGNQVPALVEAGRRVILIDNRGRGRSTRGILPLTYELMASEVVAVMDALEIETASMVGWSDGAIIGLLLAKDYPGRVRRVFAFAGNMDLSGVKPQPTPSADLSRAFDRAMRDYARLSDTPGEFKAMADEIDRLMQTQPNYSAQELAQIDRPVTIVHAEHDEFILAEHAEYLARTVPGARLITLHGVSHFAPLQRPNEFNEALKTFVQTG